MADTLTEVAEWWHDLEGSGMEKAAQAIRKLAAIQAPEGGPALTDDWAADQLGFSPNRDPAVMASPANQVRIQLVLLGARAALAAQPVDNNSMGQTGCYPAGEKTTAAPAEGASALIGPDSENYAGDEAPLPADVPYPPSLDNVTIYNPYGPMSMDPTDGQPVEHYWDRAGLRDYGARCIAWATSQAQPKGTTEPVNWDALTWINGVNLKDLWWSCRLEGMELSEAQFVRIAQSLEVLRPAAPATPSPAPAPAALDNDDIFMMLHKHTTRQTADHLDYLIDPAEVLEFARDLLANQAPAVGAQLAAFRAAQQEADIPDEDLMPQEPAQAVAYLIANMREWQ